MLARFVGTLALVALLCTASTTQGVVVTAQWAFDNNYLDSSGNGNTLTPVNTPTFVGPVAPFGTAAVDFNGPSSEYAVNAAPVGMGFTGAYSVAGWIEADFPGTTGHRAIFWRGNTGADIELYVQTGSDAMVIAHNRSNGGTFGAAVYADPASNVPLHLAYTFDGVNVTLYYNGVSQGAQPVAAPILSALHSVRVGSAPEIGGFFDGAIDELTVYTGVLTAQEIANLIDFNSLTAPPPVIPEPSTCTLLTLGALSLAWRRRGRGGRSPR